MLRHRRLAILLGVFLTALWMGSVEASAQIPGWPRGWRDIARRDWPARAAEPSRWPAVNQVVATCSERIQPDGLEIRVYAAHRAIELRGFVELLVAMPVSGKAALDKLERKSIGLIRSEQGAGQWDVYSGVGGVGELILADNVFRVRRVLVSSRQNPVEVRFDGRSRRLRSGEALLVLG